MTKTTAKYETAVLAMCQEFAHKMDEETIITVENFVGREIGGVIELWDMYLSVEDIKKALEADMTWEEFTEWYYANDEETTINLRSWLMGARPEKAILDWYREVECHDLRDLLMKRYDPALTRPNGLGAKNMNDAICKGFEWIDTEEGYQYWDSVAESFLEKKECTGSTCTINLEELYKNKEK